MFANIKLGVRLGAGFAIVLGLAVAMAGVGTYALSTLSANSEKLARNDAPRLEAALRLDVSANSNARRLTEILLAKEQKEIDRLAKQFDVNEQKTAEAVEDLSKLSLSEDAVSVMATIKENHNKYAAAAKKMTGLAQADKHDEAAEAYDKEVSPMLTKFSRSISEFLEYDDGLFSHAMDETHAVYNKGRMVLGGIAALAVLLGAFIAWASARSITKPIKAAVLIANRVAEGDLTSEIDVRSRDELGQLMSALKLMNGNLQNIVSEVRRGSGEISSASTEIAAGNLDLSRRTEQQAASLEETASSMEELTSTVKQSAENARHANQLALGASDVAVKGGVVVGQVVTTMSGISEASHKIADIIGVIDGIAFQTNILALNAAVEAARAGEQGRGFAVVATEVRTLAQRSAAAAKEIKTLIQDSVGKVDSGRKLVDQAGRTMEEIVSAVKSVTGIMAEIASAAQEQNSGIEQVNQAVSQMDQVTQQNAALVEEAAAAAASMQEQAMGLTQAVAVFKLADESDEASDDESVVSTLASQDEPEQAVSEHRPVERRSANRPANVARLPAVREAKASDKVVVAKTGTDDDWSEF